MNDSVPAGWETKKLGEFCSIRSKRAKEKLFTPFSVSKVLGIVPQSKKFKKRIASKNISNYKIIEPLDFAYDPMLLWDNSINRNNSGEIGVVSPAYTVFKIDKKQINSDYFLFFLKSSLTTNFYKKISKGTNIRRQKAEFKDFCKGTFCFPPLSEQEKIASILTSVDVVIKINESKVHKLQNLKNAMMQKLLTKGIGHTEFKDSPVGRIPKGWEVKTFGEVVRSTKSGLSRRIVSQDIGIPVLISGNIQDGKLDVSKLKYWHIDDPQGANINNYILNDGDILLCFINSISQIGKSCIYHDIGRPAIYTTNLFRIKPKQNYPSDFLHVIMSADSFQREIELITKPAVNQASFTKVDLEAIKVVCPPIKEINDISNVILSIDSNIKENQNKLSHTKPLKKALMQDLLTGKVRVKV